MRISPGKRRSLKLRRRSEPLERNVTESETDVATLVPLYGAKFSVTSMYVPQGSVRNAILVFELGSWRMGTSSLMRCVREADFMGAIF